jgi:hypothetical protein
MKKLSGKADISLIRVDRIDLIGGGWEDWRSVDAR